MDNSMNAESSSTEKNTGRSEILTWADGEIERLLKQEKESADKDNDSEGYKYIADCVSSAMRAYESLVADGHSGLSIGITRSLLNRLIDSKPLTPLTGEDSEWNLCSDFSDGNCKVYQNRRYTALFKREYGDGTVKYSDNNLFLCVDPRNPNISFQYGLAESIVKQYPEVPKVTFPYFPAKDPVRIKLTDVLSDEGNSDFDTIGIFDVEWKDENGMTRRLSVNRYFDLSGQEVVEIDKDEWERRLVLDGEIREKRKREWETERKKMTDKLVEKGLLVPKSGECDCSCKSVKP